MVCKTDEIFALVHLQKLIFCAIAKKNVFTSLNVLYFVERSKYFKMNSYLSFNLFTLNMMNLFI